MVVYSSSDAEVPTPKPLRISKTRTMNTTRDFVSIPTIPRRSSSIISNRQVKMSIPRASPDSNLGVHKRQAATSFPTSDVESRSPLSHPPSPFSENTGSVVHLTPPTPDPGRRLGIFGPPRGVVSILIQIV
jgi:hypothetical protein